MKRKSNNINRLLCIGIEEKEKFISSLSWLRISICYFGILLFLALVCCVNLFHYSYRMNADIASEAILGQVIWDSKQWIPDSWYPSTEVRVIGTANLSALFYGLSGNLQFAMGIACISVVLLIICSIYYLFKEIEGGGKMLLGIHGYVHVSSSYQL